MHWLTYVLRFTGQATPVSPDGAVLQVVTTAPSAIFTTTVGPAGLASDRQPAAGGQARCASEVTLTSATSFQEVGAITFGAGHRLRFTTVGSGSLAACADPAGRAV